MHLLQFPGLNYVVRARRNIVFTVDLDCELVLKKIAHQKRKAEQIFKVTKSISFFLFSARNDIFWGVF